MRHYFIIGILFLSINNLRAQYGIKEPVPFLPGIISVPGLFYGTAFLPDGNTVYFTSFDTITNKAKIMKSNFENGKWSSPHAAEFSGEFPDGDASISPDGSKIYFRSLRPQDENNTPAKQRNLWFAQKTSTCFGNPVFLGGKLKISGGGYPIVSNNGTLYFFKAQNDSSRAVDIFKSIPNNGEYLSFENLGEPINTKYSEFDAYIAPDESFIIFASDRPGGIGEGDLYLSWNTNGKWSEPKNLGNIINSPDLDYCPSISPDRKYFYFSRSSLRKGYMGIYRVDLAPLLILLKQ